MRKLWMILILVLMPAFCFAQTAGYNGLYIEDLETSDDIKAGDDLVVTDDASIGGDLAITGALNPGDKIKLDEISAPGGDPSSNDGWIYVKDKTGTSALYFEDDGGTVVQLGTGSATAWDDLVVPDANESLDMTTYLANLENSSVVIQLLIAQD